jgi:pimeloyl-ACP methyl ester carboxylesterase
MARMGGHSVNEQFLTINGLRLRYLEWGAKDAPAILLLHGFSSTALAWRGVGEALADKYRVVALDQRGHGASDWDAQGRYTIDDFVADARAVTQHLNLAPFILVGHSMGGAISYSYASIFPQDVTRLVIEDAAPRPANDPRPPLQPMQAPVFASRDDVVASVREAMPLMRDASVQERVDLYYMEHSDGTWRFRADVEGVRKALSSQNRNETLWGHVKNIQCPTLVIRAGQEPPGISPETVELLEPTNPRIEVVTVPDAGHNIHFAHFDDFMVLLREFLTQPAPVATGGTRVA